MSDNDWRSIESAPLDGTFVMINGYTDVTKIAKQVNMPASWNKFRKHWATRKGQIIYPLKWKPIV